MIQIIISTRILVVPRKLLLNKIIKLLKLNHDQISAWTGHYNNEDAWYAETVFKFGIFHSESGVHRMGRV